MAKVKALRGLIYERFDHEADLAKRLGWPRQRLNRITTGAKEPDIYEARALAESLEVPIDRIVQIFLNDLSPNRQQTDRHKESEK